MNLDVSDLLQHSAALEVDLCPAPVYYHCLLQPRSQAEYWMIGLVVQVVVRHQILSEQD